VTTVHTIEARRRRTAAGRTAETSEHILYDLAIELDDRPGALADLGEALGAAGLSVEGGGVFAVDGRAVAHFLVEDGESARSALCSAGIRVTAVRKVLIRRLAQQRPGQLGAIARALAEVGVNIEVQYSDHDHNLVLVIDDAEAAATATTAWATPSPAG
jgi:hypothetical protein